MISNQILQSTIDGLKGITRIDLCIIDTEGKVLAATSNRIVNEVKGVNRVLYDLTSKPPGTVEFE